MSKLPVFLVIVSAIIGSIGLGPSASAATAGTIETSSDSHDHRFFGGVLQVIVSDPNAKNGNSIEEVRVDIAAQPKSGSSVSKTFSVPETSMSSGVFEFFLAHVDNTVAAGDIDQLNAEGVEGDGCISDCAPFITFGPGGDIDFDSGLYDKVSFRINSVNIEITVDYEGTTGSLKLDRDSYGSDSFVYVSIEDDDADLNPTMRDEFMVDPNGNPNNDLLTLDGGALVDAVKFKETGDNTGIFEGSYRLGDSMIANSKSLALTIHEKTNYDSTLASPENNSNKVDEISFMIGNSDGSIGVQPPPMPTWDPVFQTDKQTYHLGQNVSLTITDQDANVDNSASDSIQLQVLSNSNKIDLNAIETGLSTGIFRASFLLGTQTDQVSHTIGAEQSITIGYNDKHPADFYSRIKAGENPEKVFSYEIDILPSVKTGIEATNITAPQVSDTDSGIMISTTITNNNNITQPFVSLIEVRDSNNVTVFLAIWNGTLGPLLSTNIGAVWQPEYAGNFEVKTFVLNSLGNGAELLSSPAVSEAKISSVK